MPAVQKTFGMLSAEVNSEGRYFFSREHRAPIGRTQLCRGSQVCFGFLSHSEGSIFQGKLKPLVLLALLTLYRQNLRDFTCCPGCLRYLRQHRVIAVQEAIDECDMRSICPRQTQAALLDIKAGPALFGGLEAGVGRARGPAGRVLFLAQQVCCKRASGGLPAASYVSKCISQPGRQRKRFALLRATRYWASRGWPRATDL